MKSFSFYFIQRFIILPIFPSHREENFDIYIRNNKKQKQAT